jgi:hypothetical protein
VRSDDWSIVASSARGRDTVRRIYPQTTVYEEAVIVFDLAHWHTPFGCVAWPAFWTPTQKGPWPTGGEVDIIDGTVLPISPILPSICSCARYLPSCRF